MRDLYGRGVAFDWLLLRVAVLVDGMDLFVVVLMSRCGFDWLHVAAMDWLCHSGVVLLVGFGFRSLVVLVVCSALVFGCVLDLGLGWVAGGIS